MQYELDRVRPCVYFYMILRSSESSSLSFRLKESQDVALSDGSLNISNKSTVVLVHEGDLNLGDTTTRTSLTNDLVDLSKYNFVAIHFGFVKISSE